MIKAQDPCGHGSGCSCCCWLTPEGDGGERGSLGDVGKWEPATFVQEHTRTHTHSHSHVHSQKFSYKFIKTNLPSDNP